MLTVGIKINITHIRLLNLMNIPSRTNLREHPSIIILKCLCIQLFSIFLVSKLITFKYYFYFYLLFLLLLIISYNR